MEKFLLRTPIECSDGTRTHALSQAFAREPSSYARHIDDPYGSHEICTLDPATRKEEIMTVTRSFLHRISHSVAITYWTLKPRRRV